MPPRALTPEEKFIQMTQTPVAPLIFRLAVPTIISMLVTSVYNMADTFLWVSWVPAPQALWAWFFR